MKIGAENRKKLWIMAVLAVIAIIATIRTASMFFGSPDSSPAHASSAVPPAAAAVPDAAPRAARQSQQAALKKGGVPAPTVADNPLDPTLHIALLQATQKIEYTGGQRNIFSMQDKPPDIPGINQSVRPTLGAFTNPTPLPTPAPTPPPVINLKFYGFANPPGGPRKAFLTNDDEIFVATEGQIVNRRYKIVQITNNSVVVEDVLNNYRKEIPKSQGGPGGAAF
ncbi:MAG TPA: hypothetical protein VKZ53_08630 [Candidatus Angelobacter sp.]|nr:hypothetical protein [Candidatus Angelobacter sp.]